MGPRAAEHARCWLRCTGLAACVNSVSFVQRGIQVVASHSAFGAPIRSALGQRTVHQRGSDVFARGHGRLAAAMLWVCSCRRLNRVVRECLQGASLVHTVLSGAQQPAAFPQRYATIWEQYDAAELLLACSPSGCTTSLHPGWHGSSPAVASDVRYGWHPQVTSVPCITIRLPTAARSAHGRLR
jgi:hypothetical protein